VSNKNQAETDGLSEGNRSLRPAGSRNTVQFARAKSPAQSGCPRGKGRSGNAIVELAVSILLLFLIVFGSIEACNAIYLQQFISETSYQGALAGIKPDATETNVRDFVDDFLDARGITTATITIQGTDGTGFNGVSPGETFLVRILVPTGSYLNGPLIAQYQDFSAESICTRQ